MGNYVVEPNSNGSWSVAFHVMQYGIEEYEHIRGFEDKDAAEAFAAEINGKLGGRYTLITRCDNKGRFTWDVVLFLYGGFPVHSKCKTHDEAVERVIALNNDRFNLLMRFHFYWYRLKKWIVDSYYAVGEFLFGEDFYSWCRCGICGKFMTSKDEGAEDPETGKWCCAKHFEKDDKAEEDNGVGTCCAEHHTFADGFYFPCEFPEPRCNYCGKLLDEGEGTHYERGLLCDECPDRTRLVYTAKCGASYTLIAPSFDEVCTMVMSIHGDDPACSVTITNGTSNVGELYTLPEYEG